MALQTAALTMTALGVLNDAVLRPGVHLRWSVDPAAGFPPHGFDVQRRAARSGTAQSVDFTALPGGPVPPALTLGPLVLRSATTGAPAEVMTELVGGAQVPVLRPAVAGAITGELTSAAAPVRRVDIDIVHSVPQSTRLLPFDFVVWGIAGGRRVCSASLRLTEQNRFTALRVSVAADALDGFQIQGRRQVAYYYKIIAVRWATVADEADDGWDPPLNPRRIGFPVTAPGYQVPHGHGADPGTGAQDWLEAADRLSPTGSAAGLPAPLAAQFGPPEFSRTREIFRAAIAGRQLTQSGSGTTAPTVEVDAIRLVQLGALDPDVARMAGLALVDGTAQPGVSYDYQVVGYWPGPIRWVWVCRDVPVTDEPVRVDLPVPSGAVRVTARSAGPGPLIVRVSSGHGRDVVRRVPAGPMRTVTVEAPDIGTVWVDGDSPVVTQVCHLEPVQDILRHRWICFGVTRGPVPALRTPVAPEAVPMPGFARRFAAEQVVGLRLDPVPARVLDTGMLPLAAALTDPISYEVQRRTEGAWTDLVTPPGSELGDWADRAADPLAGRTRPVFRSSARPAAFVPAPGWPDDPGDLVDDRLDPGVRHYHYRCRARDLHGRVSDWSAPSEVDAADRVPPPLPGAVTGRWIDRSDPYLAADDAAELDHAGVDRAALLRWSWPERCVSQAPDTVGFRVYWNDRPHGTVLAAVTAVTADADGYRVTVPLGRQPPADAFRGDWLRQGNRQYLILGNTAAEPSVLTLSRSGTEPPAAGPCSVSMRGADPERLDLLGNPLRPDPSRAAAWQRRVLEVSTASVSFDILQESAGIAVHCDAVEPDHPRAGQTTVRIPPSWVFAGPIPEGLSLSGRPVVSAALGRHGATLVVAAGPVLAPGPAMLEAPGLRTIRLAGYLPDDFPPLIGGVAWAGDAGLPVIAHTPSPLRLVVLGEPPVPYVTWLPDHQVVLTGVTLPVTAAQPEATGVLGVSAFDGRPWTPDTRNRPDEPGGPGNEGPVAAVPVRRHYLDAPAGTVAPPGVAEQWADPPDEFSGRSRFRLRWPAGTGTRFHIDHATVGDVLAADAADRAACRGAYTGAPALDPAELAAWRAQQAALPPGGLRTLADRQPSVFAPVTDRPLEAADPLLADPEPGWLSWPVPLDGTAPARHLLRVRVVDAAGNSGPPGPATPPVVVPDVRRPPAPVLRRAVGGDREVWLFFDGAGAAAAGYRILRTPWPAGSRPEPSDMTVLATVAPDRCPEPLPVVSGVVRLPGTPPDEVVAVHLATGITADGLPEGDPLPGSFPLTGAEVTGLSALPDGTLVYVAARTPAGGPVVVLPTGARLAWRDGTAEPGRAYQYRIESLRSAQVGPVATVEVRSLPSDVGEATAFDSRPPVAPAGAAAYDTATAAVRISWATGPVADLEVRCERADLLDGRWAPVSGWVPGGDGLIEDPEVGSGHLYLYRLRGRDRWGRLSRGEPRIGPVTVP
ncbi:hypothetical protein [Paractinoplanes rishiriensis]|uniref:Uncharacterized protein n=1 Tax=Paractinoplanes rishiriensis TaxID=1050105 RepID=A0A919KCV7_9ACTN|nr:hypothetical protein [Actinoplanes rishiriensis]GIF01457.1 hypothetical protein Ari01nite_89210 [Actinoplanes rishiriensis]